MMDIAEKPPKYKSYFQIKIQKETWMPIIFEVAAYLVTMGIGYLLYQR